MMKMKKMWGFMDGKKKLVVTGDCSNLYSTKKEAEKNKADDETVVRVELTYYTDK